MYTEIVVYDPNPKGGYRFRHIAKVPDMQGEPKCSLWLPAGKLDVNQAAQYAQMVARRMARRRR